MKRVLKTKQIKTTAMILSWNVRGLGWLEKRNKVRKLIGENNPFIMCI